MKHAVIYCRVSSDRQAKEGHGLSSQEASCRKYASEHGFDVQRVFTDDSTGGGDFWKRPGLTEMLDYLDQSDEQHAVIFDDLKRFARDTLFHLKLRQELGARNAYPRSPNFRFEDTPEGEFVETIIAATGELERKQNRRQVISRMKARFEAGYWVFPSPLGYKYTKEEGKTQIVLNSPECHSVKEALEGYATGRFQTQQAVCEFLRNRRCYTKRSQGRTYSSKAIRQLLGNEFYAGWCVCRKWNLRVRGHHEPLISEETHRQIIERLHPVARQCIRKDDREEFPLRGHIHCARCQSKITACWSQGRSAKYPYYRCPTKSCIGSIRTQDMEEQFLDRLHEATPTPGLFRLFETTLRSAFQDRGKLRAEKLRNDTTRIAEIDREITALVDSITRASTPCVRRIYEDKIATLQQEKEHLEQRLGTIPQFSIEPLLEKGRELLESPAESWKTGTLRRRKVVQSLAFVPPILYHPESAYRTAELSLVYRLFEESEGEEGRLVELVTKSLHRLQEELQRWGAVLTEVGW